MDGMLYKSAVIILGVDAPNLLDKRLSHEQLLCPLNRSLFPAQIGVAKPRRNPEIVGVAALAPFLKILRERVSDQPARTICFCTTRKEFCGGNLQHFTNLNCQMIRCFRKCILQRFIRVGNPIFSECKNDPHHIIIHRINECELAHFPHIPFHKYTA